MLVEQLAGPADEGQALLVLLGAGAFADEHQVGVGVAHAEHDLRATGGRQLALGAAGCLFREHLESRGHSPSGYWRSPDRSLDDDRGQRAHGLDLGRHHAGGGGDQRVAVGRAVRRRQRAAHAVVSALRHQETLALRQTVRW